MPVDRDFAGLTIAEALDHLADQKGLPEARHLTLYEIRLVRAAAELLREHDDRTPMPVE